MLRLVAQKFNLNLERQTQTPKSEMDFTMMQTDSLGSRAASVAGLTAKNERGSIIVVCLGNAKRGHRLLVSKCRVNELKLSNFPSSTKVEPKENV
jgi:hypothetical protein